MTARLVALTLTVSLLGLVGAADARSSGGHHGGSHHASAGGGHVSHSTTHALSSRSNGGNGYISGLNSGYGGYGYGSGYGGSGYGRYGSGYGNRGYGYGGYGSGYGYQQNSMNQGPVSAYWQNYWANLGSNNHVDWPSLGYTSNMNQ